MSEIGDSLWRIIEPRIQEKQGLGNAETPKKIRGRRAIAYINSEGSISTSSGNDPDSGDETGAPGAGAETDPENADQAGQTNAPGSTNGVGGSGGAGQGGDDKAADTVDDQKLGDQLQSVQGTDQTSGTADGTVKVALNAVDGFGYDAPAGWDDPDTGPIDPDWEAGKFWYGSVNSPFADGSGATPTLAAQAIVASNPSTYSLVSVDPAIGGAAAVTLHYIPGPWDVSVSVNRFDCGASQDAWCTVTEGDIRESEWPADGVCALAWDSSVGRFKGHAYDTDCSAAQKTGSAEIYTESGGARKKISRLNNGGFKITDVDGSNVDDPNGYARVYDAAGIMTDIYPNGAGSQVN